MNDWKNETCEKCDYCIDGHCRRFPPSDHNGAFYCRAEYSIVKSDGNVYKESCSEFKEKGEGLR
jgi:D-arabinose 1-dehydrogenase-like Zn-dependent alcohol dehydrogenase